MELEVRNLSLEQLAVTRQMAVQEFLGVNDVLFSPQPCEMKAEVVGPVFPEHWLLIRLSMDCGDGLPICLTTCDPELTRGDLAICIQEMLRMLEESDPDA